MFPFSGRTTQFSFFDLQLGHPEWNGKTILDFGGNVGGFLKGASPEIRHENYWCVDLSRQAVERGQADYPDAHFVFYDRYNSRNNPAGTPGLPVPDLGVSFDFILAFSVFTHTSKAEMLDTITQLHRRLRPEGKIAFTFFDPEYDPGAVPEFNCQSATADKHAGCNLIHRLNVKGPEFESVDRKGALQAARTARWLTLANGRLFVEPVDDDDQVVKLPDWSSYIQYYRCDFLKHLFSDAEVLAPLRPERQHCCVLHGRD